MTNDKNMPLEQASDSTLKSVKEDNPVKHTETEDRYERGTAIDVFAPKEGDSSEKHTNNDIATNDGSVLHTLDRVFHNAPISDNITDNNRAEHYEPKSDSKVDDEEEINAIKNRPVKNK